MSAPGQPTGFGAATPAPPARRPGCLKGQIWFASGWNTADNELADLMTDAGAATPAGADHTVSSR